MGGVAWVKRPQHGHTIARTVALSSPWKLRTVSESTYIIEIPVYLAINPLGSPLDPPIHWGRMH
jgi:hypothetical protein